MNKHIYIRGANFHGRVCDVCGESIEDPSHGLPEWLTEARFKWLIVEVNNVLGATIPDFDPYDHQGGPGYNVTAKMINWGIITQ